MPVLRLTPHYAVQIHNGEQCRPRRAFCQTNGESQRERRIDRERVGGRDRGDVTAPPTKSDVEPSCLAPQFSSLIQVAKYVTVGRRIHYVPCRGGKINTAKVIPKLG